MVWVSKSLRSAGLQILLSYIYSVSLYHDDDSDNTDNDKGVLSKEDNTFPTILESEVRDAIKRLPKNKPMGIDELPAELLKMDNPLMVKVFCKLCNRIVETGEWPTHWMKSIVITLPKVTGATECAGHRTIALISHASKILLQILLQRTVKVAEEQFAEEEMGFRKRVGT